MTIAIIGSDILTDYSKLEEGIKKLNLEITRVVCGGNQEALDLVKKFARKHDLPLTIYVSNWDEYGVTIEHVHNVDMIKDAEYVVAFWDGISKETPMILQIANELKVPGILIRT